jgi:hypothetical protein
VLSVEVLSTKCEDCTVTISHAYIREDRLGDVPRSPIGSGCGIPYRPITEETIKLNEVSPLHLRGRSKPSPCYYVDWFCPLVHALDRSFTLPPICSHPRRLAHSYPSPPVHALAHSLTSALLCTFASEQRHSHFNTNVTVKATVLFIVELQQRSPVGVRPTN